MNRGFLILTIIIFFTSFSNFFSQVKHPWKNGEKILNYKIEKYKQIDSLDNYQPMNAIEQNKILNFEVWRNEGDLEIKNVNEKIYGKGGVNIYNFIDKATKKTLKIEYNVTKHIYIDETYKDYKNSELRKITIFFNEKNEPDFAKIYENQYDNEKVLASAIYYLNLSEEQNYYINSDTKSLIETIKNIVESYKK
ncbi:hypothetical protein [Soonwooa purpurea]